MSPTLAEPAEKPAWPRAECKLCGRPIVWGVTADNKRIPLDPRPVIYRLSKKDGQEAPLTARAGDGVFMVSHFATCPKVGDLPRKPKK